MRVGSREEGAGGREVREQRKKEGAVGREEGVVRGEKRERSSEVISTWIVSHTESKNTVCISCLCVQI